MESSIANCIISLLLCGNGEILLLSSRPKKINSPILSPITAHLKLTKGFVPEVGTVDCIGSSIESILSISMGGVGGTAEGHRAHPLSAPCINIVSSCERAEHKPPGDLSECQPKPY